MDLDAAADPGEEGDRQLATEVLAELLEPSQEFGRAVCGHSLEGGVPQTEPEALEQGADARLLALGQQPQLNGVARIERDTDGATASPWRNA